jgi:hypothetical protein
MRHVVYMLVVVNLVFLGWNIFQSQTAMQPERNLPALSETAVPLVTLQEKEQAAADEASVIDVITANEPPGAGAGLVCLTLGPFFERDVMQATEAKLVTMGLEPQQRESERKHPVGYWVYLPEMERGESLRLAQILDEHSDKEYFIGKGNLISLGAFKEMSRARIRLKRVRKLGLDPLLETRYRTSSGYWLDFQAEPSRVEQLAGLVADTQDVWLEDRACY